MRLIAVLCGHGRQFRNWAEAQAVEHAMIIGANKVKWLGFEAWRISSREMTHGIRFDEIVLLADWWAGDGVEILKAVTRNLRVTEAA